MEPNQKVNGAMSLKTQNNGKGIGDKGFDYQNVMRPKGIHMTTNMQKQQQTIAKFFEFVDYNFLFILGPSGCGKRFHLEELLRRSGIKPSVIMERMHETDSADNDSEENSEQSQIKYIEEVILQQLQQECPRTDYPRVTYDYPLFIQSRRPPIKGELRNFQKALFNTAQKTKIKMVFCINNTMCNEHTVLNRNLPEQFHLQKLKNVLVVRVNPYNKHQMKKIVHLYLEQYSMYTQLSKEIIDQAIEKAQGDARCVKKLIYQAYIHMKATTKNSSSNIKNKLQFCTEERFTIFHLTGKFLYGKRQDPDTGVVDYYTEKQITSKNMPFYFDPIKVIQQSRISLKLFHNLIYSNYLDRFGKVKDARNLANLLSLMDVAFPWWVMVGNSGGMVDDNLKETAVALLAYGPLVYNKNGSLTKKNFTAFRKTDFFSVSQQISQKKKFARRYYQKVRFKDLALYANLCTANHNFRHPVTKLFSATMRNPYSGSREVDKHQRAEQIQTSEKQLNYVASGHRAQLTNLILRQTQEQKNKQALRAKRFIQADCDNDSDIQLSQSPKQQIKCKETSDNKLQQDGNKVVQSQQKQKMEQQIPDLISSQMEKGKNDSSSISQQMIPQVEEKEERDKQFRSRPSLMKQQLIQLWSSSSESEDFN